MQCLEPELGKLVFDVDNLEDLELREKVNHHLLECQYCQNQWSDYKNLMKELQNEEEFHPDSEKLTATVSKYSEIKLLKSEKKQIEQHLQYCQKCQERATYLRQTDEILANVENKEALPLPPNWTPEREELFTERVMNGINKIPHKDLVEVQSSIQYAKSWYENCLQSIKGWLFVRPKHLVLSAFGIIFVLALFFGLYRLFPTKETVVLTNSGAEVNSSPNLNNSVNSSNQKVNKNQLINSTPVEERADANQQKQSPAIEENRLGNKNSEQQSTEITPQTLYALNDTSGLIAIDSNGKTTGLSEYAPRVRENISRTLIKGSSEFPQLAEVEYKRIIQMGNGTEPKPFTLDPNGMVLRTDRPVFTWEKYKDADSYNIKIFDVFANFQLVKISDSLKDTSWMPTEPLQRGRVYSWELWVNLEEGERKKLPERGQIKFKILDAQTETELRQVESIKPKSHLVLGILYARAGLFEDAEREFQELVRLNPDSKKATDLLKSVQSRIKR